MLKALTSQIVLDPGNEDQSGIDTEDASAETGIEIEDDATSDDAGGGGDDGVLDDDPASAVIAAFGGKPEPKAKGKPEADDAASDAEEDDEQDDEEQEFDVDTFIETAATGEKPKPEGTPKATPDAKTQPKAEEKPAAKAPDPNADPEDVTDDDVSELFEFLDITDESYPGAAKAMKATVAAAKQVKTLQTELLAAQQMVIKIANFVTMQTHLPIMDQFGQRMPKNPFKGSKGLAAAREVYERAGELRAADEKAKRKVQSPEFYIGSAIYANPQYRDALNRRDRIQTNPVANTAKRPARARVAREDADDIDPVSKAGKELDRELKRMGVI